MSGSALIVMLLAMALIWGGLVFSVVHLIKNPDVDMDKLPND